MSLANLGEPVTFVRSPMLTKLICGVSVNASCPDSRSQGSTVGTWRGANSLTAAAMALMCAGVVPQQPPTILSQPFAAQSRSCGASVSGVSGNPVGDIGSGSPALG